MVEGIDRPQLMASKGSNIIDGLRFKGLIPSIRAYKFGPTHVVEPKGKHQATIVWLHGLGDDGLRLRDQRRKGRGIPTIKSKLIKRKRRSGLCRAFGVLGLTTERRDGLKEKETKIAVAREGKEASPRTTQRKGLREVVATIEMIVDFKTIKLEEIIGKLKTYEERIEFRKASQEDNRGGNQTRGRWKDRDEGHTSDESEGTDNKPRRNGDKSQIDCYKCGKLGHYAYECANKKKEEFVALLVETDDEPTLLIIPIGGLVATAQARKYDNEPNGYPFQGCKIMAGEDLCGHNLDIASGTYSRLRDRMRKGRGIPTIKSKLIKRKRRSGLCRAFGVLGLTTERRDGLKEKETKIAVSRERKEASPRTTQRKGLPAHSQQLKSEFEGLVMKEDESIDSFARKLMSIITKAATYGLTFDEQTKVRKVLNAIPDKFLPVVATIEMIVDFKTVKLEEIIGKLKTYEERIKFRKASQEDNSEKLLLTRQRNNRNYKHNYRNGRRGGGNQTRGRWKDRDEGHTSDESEGTDNKPRRNGDKSQIDCYKCGKLGHYAYECANKKKEEVAALLVETDDEPELLMCLIDEN
ncbi:zinc finger, CCHC-type containing protein [Tanacetum coccineum]